MTGGNGLGYDAVGNLSGADGQTYTWDGWGRLTGVGATISYGYDSAGRRVRKTVGGVSTYYLYAGNAVIAELNASGGLVRSYSWGATGLLCDYVPGAGSSAGKYRTYVFDGLGNTLSMLDADGQSRTSICWTSTTGQTAKARILDVRRSFAPAQIVPGTNR